MNIVTTSLFRKYRTAQDFASANRTELEKDVYSTGFYRAKANNIIRCCKVLVEQHHGEVPQTMEELIQLSGVGRKTANVVLGYAFGKAEGIVVDTHVKRVSQRLGLTSQTNPEKVELDLMKAVPKQEWINIDNLFVWHGRNVCIARKPKCTECPLNDLCPSAGEFIK